MNRRQFLRATGLLAAGAAVGGGWWALLRERGLVQRTRRFRALGAGCDLTVLHADVAAADDALAGAEALVHGLERIFSVYDAASDVSRLNRDGVLDGASPDLIRLLLRAGAWNETTDGAFDVTVQPLWEAAASGLDPRSARSSVGFRGVRIHRGRVWFERPGMSITCNGIAQGSITDAVHARLARAGIAHALVNCGEFRNLGDREAGAPWRLGIQHPRHDGALLGVIEADGRAVATSGNRHARSLLGGGHCFDPRTGRIVRHWESVTVLADDATTADALSTALFVMAPDEAGAFCAVRPELGVLAVERGGRVMRTGSFPPFVA